MARPSRSSRGRDQSPKEQGGGEGKASKHASRLDRRSTTLRSNPPSCFDHKQVDGRITSRQPRYLSLDLYGSREPSQSYEQLGAILTHWGPFVLTTLSVMFLSAQGVEAPVVAVSAGTTRTGLVSS